MMGFHAIISRAGRLVTFGFRRRENMDIPEPVDNRDKRVQVVGCIYLVNNSSFYVYREG